MRAFAAALAIFLAGSNMVNAAVTETPPSTLLLEVWINGRTHHQIVRLQRVAGEYRAAARELLRAGLRMDDTDAKGTVALAGLRGVSFTIDQADQRLLIAAAPERLQEQSFDLRPSILDIPQSTAARGASLTYDLSATANGIGHAGATQSGGGTVGLNVFAPDILLTATAFGTSGLGESGGARLDTSLEFDDPSLPRHVILGDAISGSVAWSRAVRFGGFEIASDYSLRPDLVTFPLPSFFDRASVPETVDVLVGSAKVFEEDIDPGPFALHNLPIVTGGGSATVVTTDVLGRQTSQTVSLYTTPDLLAQGLTDYSVDAGFMRYDYGEQSFDYRTPMASVVYRRGFEGFTLGAHGEAAPNLALAGGEIAFSLGGFGALSAAGAVSDGALGAGALTSLDLQGHIGPFNGFVSIQSATAHYQDVAALEDGLPPRLRLQTGASLALPYGSFGLSWVRESQNEQGASDELIASYSLSMGNGWFVGLTALRDFVSHQYAAQIYLGIPMGDGIASASYSAASGGTTEQAQFDAPANPDGGVGYDMTAQMQGSNAQAEGDVTWVGQHATLDGGISTADGQLAARTGASGALVFVGGDMFATRQPDGSLALVQAGAPDVRIYRDNREVAVSDASGQALLTGLVPYTENRIAVDPRDYPMTSLLGTSEQTVVPQRSSAVVVDLAPKHHHAAIVILRLANGYVPALGTVVTESPSGTTLMVGRDGEIFISDLTANEDLSLSVGRQSCVLHVELPADLPVRVPRIGPLLCRLGVPA